MAVARARSERALPSAGVAVRLRRVLAMRRRCGLPWSDAAYDEIVIRLTEPLSEQERETWRLILHQQRESWRSAYEHQPAMIMRLADLLD